MATPESARATEASTHPKRKNPLKKRAILDGALRVLGKDQNRWAGDGDGPSIRR